MRGEPALPVLIGRVCQQQIFPGNRKPPVIAWDCSGWAGANQTERARSTETKAAQRHQTEVKAWSKYRAAARDNTVAVQEGTRTHFLWVMIMVGTSAVNK